MIKNIKKIAHALLLVLLLCIVLGFGSSALTVRAESAEPTPYVSVNFENGVSIDGLTNVGATHDEATGSAVFNGSSYMYFEPDISNNVKGSFTVILGAYLSAQNSSGYVFNTGYYANGVAVELNYNNLRFYFGNDTELAFTLKSILTTEETFYLITVGYNADSSMLFYRAQTGTELATEKSGSAYTSSQVAFGHSNYSLTLGAQSRAGADTVNYANCKINRFNIYQSFIDDEEFIDSTFNLFAGIETPEEPSEPTTPEEPSLPDEEAPSTPQEPAEEPFFFSTWGIIGIVAGAMVWLLIFGALTVKLINAEELKHKVIISVVLGLLAVGFFTALYFILGVLI